MQPLHTLRLLAALLVLPLVTTACVTTQVNGYTDNAYRDHKVYRIAVRAANANFAFAQLLENELVDEFKDKGIRATSFLAMFPPTRDWTNAQVTQALKQRGFDGIMYVNLTGADSQETTIGYVNTGSASVYGGSASYRGHSTAMTAIRRYTSTRASLYDVASGHKIWIADTNTNAGGLLYQSDDTQAESIAEEIVAALHKSGHL
jgi:hypothetical protein